MTQDKRNQLLVDCIISGQVDAAEIVTLIQENPGLRELLIKRYKAQGSRSSAG